ERDETLVLAAVVPHEMFAWQKDVHDIEDRLIPLNKREVGGLFCLRVCIFVGRRGKEGGWRELATIAGDDCLLCTRDRRNSVSRKHLAGFIEDNQVKGLHPGSRKHLAHQ